MRILSVLGAGVALVFLVVLFVRYVCEPAHGESSPRRPSSPFVFAIAQGGAVLRRSATTSASARRWAASSRASPSHRRPNRETHRRPPRAAEGLPPPVLLHRARGDVSTCPSSGRRSGQRWSFSVFVLVGNPLIVLAIMGGDGLPQAHGLPRRPHGGADLGVSRSSSSPWASTIGHVSPDALGLVTLVASSPSRRPRT